MTPTLNLLIELAMALFTAQAGTLAILLRVMFILGRLEGRSADARNRLSIIERHLGLQ